MSLCIAIVVIDYLWIIIIIVFQVYSIENESGRKEKSSNTASRGRENSKEIAQVARKSVKDISRTIRKLEGIPEERSIETQALGYREKMERCNR